MDKVLSCEGVNQQKDPTQFRTALFIPFAGSQIASGAQTMPAVASSTVTSLSFPQLMRSVLSQTKIPLDPVRCAASHDVYSAVRTTMNHKPRPWFNPPSQYANPSQ